MSKKGPLPRFSGVHTWQTLELLQKYGRIGRKQLVRKLGIGEGSVRTILKRLERRGLVASSRGGHFLTSKGRHFLAGSPRFVRVEVGDLAVGKVSIATLVRGAASKVRFGVEQRDEAIKAGAAGATVLVFKHGRLQFPGKIFKIRKSIAKHLIKLLRPREGDAVVIGTGDTFAKAEAGARAAARSLTGRREQLLG
jgi:predicted transcriptional regulator